MSSEDKIPSLSDFSSLGNNVWAVYALLGYWTLRFLNKIGGKIGDFAWEAVGEKFKTWITTLLKDLDEKRIKELEDKLDNKVRELEERLEIYIDKEVASIKRHDQRNAEETQKLLRIVSSKLDKNSPHTLEEAIIEITE